MGIVRWIWKDTNGSHCGCLGFRTNRTAEKSDIFIFLDWDMGQSLKIIRGVLLHHALMIGLQEAHQDADTAP